MRFSFVALSLLLSCGSCGLLPSCRSSSVAVDAGPAALASADRTAPKKPPAVRAAHVKTPPRPDLPSLAAHAAPALPPADANLDDSPCHSVWTGSQAASLACARSLLFGATEAANTGGGATMLVPRALLSRDPSTLPAISDHRVDGTEGPTRNQGSAPVCTAFATAAAIDHALTRWSGRPASTSTMHIWSRYHSPSVETSLLSNVGQAIGPEQIWPFDAREASTWVPCADLPKSSNVKCGLTVDDARVRTSEAGSIGELTEVEYLPTPLDTKVLRAKIAAGQDIMVGMELPQTFVPTGRPGAVTSLTTRSPPDRTRGTPSSSRATRSSRTGRTSSRTTAGGPRGETAGTPGFTRRRSPRGRTISSPWTRSRSSATRAAARSGSAGRRRARLGSSRTASAPPALRLARTEARATTMCARSPGSVLPAT